MITKLASVNNLTGLLVLVEMVTLYCLENVTLGTGYFVLSRKCQTLGTGYIALVRKCHTGYRL